MYACQYSNFNIRRSSVQTKTPPRKGGFFVDLCIFTAMATSKPFLKAIAVSKIYPGSQASGIKKLDLTIEPGKITAIIGASGSGKTTLLRLLYGLLTPDSGHCEFKGVRVWGPDEKLIPGHDAMKMVTQHTDDLNLFASVWDNVASMLSNTDMEAKRAKPEQVLRQLNLFHLADKQIVNLSGGERQRVSIARALITSPDVLLLDEPFNQVDTTFRDGLQQDIRNIVKETGLTAIIVSHDPAEVLSMADDLIVLKDGAIAERGDPKTIYESPASLYTAKLLSHCNVITKKEAEVLGIRAEKEHVVIYPEWIELAGSWMNRTWRVSEISFKGPYEELTIVNGEVSLRVINREPGKFAKLPKVSLKGKKYLQF